MYYNDYSREDFDKKIENFSSKKVGNTVSTETNGYERVVEVSDQYKFFDFKKFVIDVLDMFENDIENYNIEKYSLSMNGAIQEVSFLANKTNINDDVYYQFVSILNSNDKSRSLQFNAGLYREVSKTSIVVPVDAASHKRVIHRWDKFDEKVGEMKSFLTKLNLLATQQIHQLKEYTTETILVRDLVSALYNENLKEGVVATASEKRAETFLHSLFYSSVNDINKTLKENFEYKDYHKLKYPTRFLNSNFDISISLYHAALIYMASHSYNDSAIIRRESNRFFSLSNKVVNDTFDYDFDKVKLKLS